MRVWYIFVFVWILPLGVNAKDEPRKHPLAVFANCDEVCFDNALNDDLTLKDDIEPIKAPSFDCTKAHNAIEQMICKDKEIAMLDALMEQRYKYVKDYIPTLVESNPQLQAIGQKELKNMLLSMQRDWLKTLQSCQNLPSNKARLCVRELLALRVLSLAIFPYDRFYPDTLGELDDFNNMGISYFNNAWDFMTYLSLNYGCYNALSVLITNKTEANKPLVYYTWERFEPMDDEGMKSYFYEDVPQEQSSLRMTFSNELSLQYLLDKGAKVAFEDVQEFLSYFLKAFPNKAQNQRIFMRLYKPIREDITSEQFYTLVRKIALDNTADKGFERVSYELLPLILKDKGEDIDLNAKDENGNTLMHHIAYNATYGSNMSVFHILKDFGVDVNAKNKNGDTPLHILTQKGNPYLIAQLLALGGDSSVRNNEGLIPLQVEIFSRNYYREVLKLLCEQQAKEETKIQECIAQHLN